MRKSQADTPLGGLLNRRLLPENYAGEIRTFLRVKPGGVNPLVLFNWLISEFVVNNRRIDQESYSKVFTDCLEYVRTHPRRNSSKRELFLYLSKFPWYVIFTDSHMIRKELRCYDQKISRVIYSKRALGSAKFEEWRKNFRLELIRIPGLTKQQFPEPRYIGVGYRDKGSSRDKSHDASPTWQEVAANGLPEAMKSKNVSQDRHQLAAICDLDGNLAERQQRKLRKKRREAFSLLD